MTRSLRDLLPALVALVVALPAAAQEPASTRVGAWVGAWEGDGVRLELRAVGAGLEGTVEVGGERYPARLAQSATGLAGTFDVPGGSHALTLARDGADARLESGGMTRRLRRVTPPAPVPPGPWAWEALGAPEGCFASRARLDGGARAPALMIAALDEVGRAFGQRPRAVSAFADAEGLEGHALFEGVHANRPVRGVLIVRAGAAGAPATVLVGWTRAEGFAAALPALEQALVGNQQARARPAPVEWQPVIRFADGSGQVRLPAGWQATFAQKGAIDANGPQGWLSFGAARTVFTPQGAAGWFARPPLVADYSNPLRAFEELIPQDNAYARQTGGWVTEEWRLVEQSPTDYPGGQAAFLHGEGTTVHPDGRRVRFRNLTLVVMAPIDAGQWMYYLSQVGAPADAWATSLPVLMEIWSSWKVSDQELRSRLLKAAETMREINDIWRGTSEARSAAAQNTSDAWGHVLRGTWPVEDQASGRRSDADLGHLRPSLDALNQAAGYERWREVPLNELGR